MPKRLDLQGEHFGEWEVKEYIGNSKWLCRCSCGVEREVIGKTLKSGASKSCGHDTNTFEDLKGQTFGEYTVIEYKGKIDNSSKWLCKCSCGEIKIVPKAYLKTNPNPNCGHIRTEKLQARNSKGRIKLEGKTFGEWEVQEYIGNKHYRCKCSCGKIKEVAYRDLVQGISQSCGHNNGKHRVIDISGREFGELKVEKYLGNKLWLCRCSCGEYTKVLKGNLLNGSVRSCGCKQYDRVSKEEIESKIDGFTRKNGRAPFVSEVSVLIDRHDAHTREYIRRYELNNKLNQTFDSKAECEIHELFSKLDNVVLHDRKILSGEELDIYIPTKKLAIEFNGTYWHSDIYKETNYHQHKTIECAKKGIHLIHIFEYEWENKKTREQLINYINRLIQDNTKRIYGRCTEIKDISAQEANEFCEKYHLQGSNNSAINIGCLYNNELVGVMTVGSPRYNSNYEYELHRLCWKDDIAVIGGSEKLFKYLINKYNTKSVVTYVDISKFTGKVYTRLGFKPIEDIITKPSYHWVNSHLNTVLSRYQSQKHLLIEQGLGIKEQTEDEIMNSLGYLKVYNSGNLKLAWKKED